MNDNEPKLTLEREVTGIIESFAPGYNVSLKSYAATKRALLRIKLSILLAVSAAFVYLAFFASQSPPVTMLALLLAAISTYGLWSVDALEREIGIWKLNYKPLWGTRIKYPHAWEFHPAENAMPAQIAAR